MFTFNEIRKHVVLSDDSSGTESDSDSSVEENDTKQMSVYTTRLRTWLASETCTKQTRMSSID